MNSTLSAAKKAGIPVIVDPKGKDYSKYKGASFLTPNKREALDACGMDGYLPDALVRAGQKLTEQLELQGLVITEGEKGMTLFERDGGTTKLNARARETYDVTGAGDTVIACLGVALAAGLTKYDAVFLSNLAASLVVEQVGTTAISIENLIDKLESIATRDHPGADAAPL